jgi:putative phosphoribosyl transferase
MTAFRDRVDAGRRLAERLAFLRDQDVVVLGLPRGGVPVAFEVAEELNAPLDVLVVRKLGVPFQPELAMGAIGEGGARVLDADVCRRARISEDDLRHVERREREELDARVARYRRGRERVDLGGRVAIVVDDGLATGSTARVACQVARQLGAARVVLAVPVAPSRTLQESLSADEVVCLSAVSRFVAVGYHYLDFSPTTDEEVIVLLDAASRRGLAAYPGVGTDADVDVEIPAGATILQGHLHVPDAAAGVVVFAHGSAAAGTAPGTGSLRTCCIGPAWAPCCSTCSPRTRRSIAPTCSTSNCSPTGWPPRPSGSAPGRTLLPAESAISAPARERGRRCGPPRTQGCGSQRWCPAADAPTWPDDASHRCRHPLC